jgi:hypothetical protein
MENQIALIIKTDGTKEVTLFTEGHFLELAQKTVGGWIQLVRLPSKGIDLYLNEEGKLDGLPQNPIATALWSEDYGLFDYIVGNVIITGGANSEGETVGLTEGQLATLFDYNRQIEML